MDHIQIMSDDPVFRWLDRVVLDLHFDACAFQPHIEQATKRIWLFQEAASRWTALEQLVSDRNWPERLVIALEQSLMGGTSRQAYVNESDISVPTANLDLRRLVDAGWLTPEGRGRASRYAASPQLRDLLKIS